MEYFLAKNFTRRGFRLIAHSRTRHAAVKSPVKTISTSERPTSSLRSSMNALSRFVVLVFLLSMEADALIFQQRLPRPNSIERHLQRERDESEPAMTDFPAEVAAAKLRADPAENFSTFAAFVDVLTASASSSNDSSFDSNWLSTVGRSDVPVDKNHGSSTNGGMLEDAFTPSPDMSSLSDETDSLISLDQVVGSTFSSSGDLENTIGDANMADGANVPNSLATMQLPSGIVLANIALHMFVLVLKMTN